MPYAPKLILHAPPWDSPLLVEFVEACLHDEVALICVVGDDCERVHDVIDELVVGDGSPERGLGPVTTWHDHETLADVRSFALMWKGDGAASGVVQEVTLETIRAEGPLRGS